MKDPIQHKVDQFFKSFPKRTYSKGQTLIFAGENPEYIYYLVKGRVIQHDISYKGDEVIVNVFKPGAFFPMSWALTQEPNNYFFKTDEACEVHIANIQATVEFVKANPDVLLDLTSRLYRGMDALLGRIVHLMSGTAQSRLLYELIIESRRFGTETDDHQFILSSNETDLAGRTGLTRETVSREMHKLKGMGLLTVDGRGIVITNMPALQKKHQSLL